jgi:putative transposase
MQEMASAGKRFKPEQIIYLLREIEVLMGSGKTIHEACKQSGNSEQTYYR